MKMVAPRRDVGRGGNAVHGVGGTHGRPWPEVGWSLTGMTSSSSLQAVGDDVLQGLYHFPFLQIFGPNGRWNLQGSTSSGRRGRGEAGEQVHSIIQLSSCMHHVILSRSFITVCVPGHGGCGQLASASVFIWGAAAHRVHPQVLGALPLKPCPLPYRRNPAPQSPGAVGTRGQKRARGQ